MGYTTKFNGGLRFNRELTHKEWVELRNLGNCYDTEVYKEYTETPETLPSSYLQWQPNPDGTELVWNDQEKFYDYIHWLRWLIKHYLKPHNIVVNGEIIWQGEEVEDRGIITAYNNKITTKALQIEGIVKCPSCSYKFIPGEN